MELKPSLAKQLMLIEQYIGLGICEARCGRFLSSGEVTGIIPSRQIPSDARVALQVANYLRHWKIPAHQRQAPQGTSLIWQSCSNASVCT